MSLLATLPDPAALGTSLTNLTGSAAGGTGLAGVLKLLQGLDLGSAQAALTSKLDGSLSASVSVDPAQLVGVAPAAIQKAAAALPRDPKAVLGPLLQRLESAGDLALRQIPGRLSGAVTALKGIDAVTSVNPSGLVADVAAGSDAVKAELLAGVWADLRAWSAQVGKLQAEIAQLLAGGQGSPEDRLLAWLAQKVAGLTSLLLPKPGGPAVELSTQLDLALSPPRIAAVAAAQADLARHFGEAQLQFQGGDFAGAAHLAAAKASLTALAAALADIAAALGAALHAEQATGEGLAHALSQRLDGLAAAEMVDLTHIRERIAAAIAKLEAAVQGVDLAAARGKVEALLAQVRDVAGEADLGKLMPDLAALTGPLGESADLLAAGLLQIVASLRAVLTQVRDALRSAASTLGSFDAQGHFHFKVEQEATAFLNGIKTTLDATLRPLLDQFKATVDQVLQKVQGILTGLQGEIQSVQTALHTGLQGAADQLVKLDVPGKMETARKAIEGMLEGIGQVDFDAVVAPVVAALGQMRDQLAKLDLSAMSEITVGAFKLSLQVVAKVNFAVQISDVLLHEIDGILQLPKTALVEIRKSAQAVVDRLAALDPAALLAPVGAALQPVTAALDGLAIASLTAPLEDWHRKALERLGAVAPEKLLKPLLDLHAELVATVGSLAPAALVQPLGSAVADLAGKLAALDLTAPLGALRDALDSVRKRLDALRPEQLIDPLIAIFDKVDAALGGFDPGALLAPATAVFDQLAGPLANLSDGQAAALGAAFAPLQDLAAAFDPGRSFQVLQQEYAELSKQLDRVDVGQILAALRTPYESMSASFQAGGAAGASLSVSVTALNPLRNDDLAKAAAAFQQIRDQLAAFPPGGPPADLAARFAAVKSRLDALVPSWVHPGLTPDEVRKAFAQANPAALVPEVHALYQAVRDKWHELDPRPLKESLRQTFESITGILATLDPAAAAAAVQGAVDRLRKQLAALDPAIVAGELQGLSTDVNDIVAALDPQPIVGGLAALVADVKVRLEALNPAALLGGLQAPLGQVKGLAAALDPVQLATPLEAVFGQIRTTVAAIDLGALLQPLVDRLDTLRGELEAALDRTAAAFDEMLAAAPV